MKHIVSRYLTLGVLVLMFLGCESKTSQQETQNPVPTSKLGTLSGVITSITGDPLEGVRVSSAAKETFSNNKGEYTLSLNAAEKVSIIAKLSDYTVNSKNVKIEADNVSTLDMVLAPIDKTVVFDVAKGAEIQTKGAKVKLEPSSIVNEDGTTYEGNVTAKVAFNQVSVLVHNIWHS